MQREQVEFALLAECLRSPAMQLRGDFDVAQHGVDVDGVAVVTAVIFAKPFHAENFMQSREDAKKFLTRITRINTNSILKFALPTCFVGIVVTI
jgi:hypothetical protein